MRAQVLSKVAFICTCVVAELTYKRLFSCMHAEMPCQLPSVRICLVTSLPSTWKVFRLTHTPLLPTCPQRKIASLERAAQLHSAAGNLQICWAAKAKEFQFKSEAVLPHTCNGYKHSSLHLGRPPGRATGGRRLGGDNRRRARPGRRCAPASVRWTST